MMKQSHSQLPRPDFASRRRLPWHFVSPTDELRRLVSQAAPRVRRFVSASRPSRLCFRKRATDRCHVSCAPEFQTSLVDGQPPAPPKCVPRRQRRLRFAACPPRSLPLSQSGTIRSRLSILRGCRHTAPSSSRLVSSVHRRSAQRELRRRTSLRKIAGCPYASSPRRTEFPSTRPAYFPQLSRSPVFPHRAFAAA